jgi:hypothetical protein
MNITAQEENVRMLAAIAGLEAEEAARRLDVLSAITFDDLDPQARLCADHVFRMLSRTIERVSVNTDSRETPVVEIVIGQREPRFAVNRVHVWIAAEDRIIVSRDCGTGKTGARVHAAGILLAACYACALALKAFLGDAIPFASPDTVTVDLNELYPDDVSRLGERVNIGPMVIAGAGAIGNGLIYGLNQFDVTGRIDIADDDNVSRGNLQRCLLFDESNIGANKAEALCTTAAPLLLAASLIPHPHRVERLSDSKDPKWLPRLAVAVDSRLARRRLQSEMAGEVFDASTTGVEEVVLHYHREPNTGSCLSCLYWEAPEEAAHEQHIAASLGVSLDHVRRGQVSRQAAQLIASRHPDVDAAAITGLPFDTVFKQVVCSSDSVRVGDAESVLTPFAFVSVLAGTFLAIEVVRRTLRPATEWNVWRLSPWSQPLPALRKFNPRREACEFCSNPELLSIAENIWSQRSI